MNIAYVEELFERTLDGTYDDEGPWEAVRALQILGTPTVLDYATGWCQSENPLKRARGADVLGQLGKTAEHPSNCFPAESFTAVSQMLENETELRPIVSAISALGHLNSLLAIPLISGFSSHSSAEIRFSVACALGPFADQPEVVQTLLRLMRDVNGAVRNWATFGVGVLGNSDSVEIRNALVSCLTDSDEDAREEAVIGLAKRNDRRVLSTLIEMLHRSEPPDRAIEAASIMLDRMNEDTQWTAHQYILALNERFQRQRP